MQKVSARRLRRLASVGIAIEGEQQYSGETRNKDYGKQTHHNQPQPSQPKETATMSTPETQTEKVKDSNKHNTGEKDYNIDPPAGPAGLKGEELFSYHVARTSSETHWLYNNMRDNERPIAQVQRGAVAFGIAFVASAAAAVGVRWLFSTKVAPVPTDVAPMIGVKK
jgi:hypothetical protein